jgi:hypothetical protein
MYKMAGLTVVCLKQLCVYVIPSASSHMEETPACPVRSPVRRFWFLSYVENRL